MAVLRERRYLGSNSISESLVSYLGGWRKDLSKILYCERDMTTGGRVQEQNEVNNTDKWVFSCLCRSLLGQQNNAKNAHIRSGAAPPSLQRCSWCLSDREPYVLDEA